VQRSAHKHPHRTGKFSLVQWCVNGSNAALKVRANAAPESWLADLITAENRLDAADTLSSDMDNTPFVSWCNSKDHQLNKALDDTKASREEDLGVKVKLVNVAKHARGQAANVAL
jgi:hypothetical protein